MSPPADDRVAPPPRGEEELPDLAADEGDDDAGDADDLRSLLEDIHALIDDGKTYLDAELNYQKTRAAFIADRGKAAVFFGAIAAAFGFVALIALTIGLIIALTPWLTAWGASALVVLLLAVFALLAARAASRRWNSIVAVIDEGQERRP